MEDEYLDGLWAELGSPTPPFEFVEEEEPAYAAEAAGEDMFPPFLDFVEPELGPEFEFEQEFNHEQHEHEREQHQHEEEYHHEHEPEAENEWTDIIETENGLETQTRTIHDELEEPQWGYEEDQQRVDRTDRAIREHLHQEEVEDSWSSKTASPDFQAAKKKKKHKTSSSEESSSRSFASTPPPLTVVADTSAPTQTLPPPPPPPVKSQPTPPPPSAPVQAQPPPVQAQPPPPVKAQPPPASPQPPPALKPPAATQPQPSAAKAPATPTTTAVAAAPKPYKPGSEPEGLTLPIAGASSTAAANMSGGYPFGYAQDLGGLGQIGVFTDSSANHVQRMDSFAFFITFVFAYLYIHI